MPQNQVSEIRQGKLPPPLPCVLALLLAGPFRHARQAAQYRLLAGLAHLRELSKLQVLNLSRTEVTEARVQELRKALPGTRTVR